MGSYCWRYGSRDCSTSPLRTARDSVKGYCVANRLVGLTLSILCFKECSLRARIRRLHGPAWIVDEWNGCCFYVQSVDSWPAACFVARGPYRDRGLQGGPITGPQ